MWHSVGLLLLYGALDGHPFFPSHVASRRCFLSAAAAGALAGVVSVFAEPSSWCVGTVLDVAWCAVCAFAPRRCTRCRLESSRPPGEGEGEMCKNVEWRNFLGADIIWQQFLKYQCKFWYKFPDCGTRTSIDCE